MFSFPNPLRLIVDRARRVLSDLEDRIQRGEISTRPDLLVGIVAAVHRFIDGIRAPTMTVPRMGKDELLLRELVEDPIRQADEDIVLAGAQLDTLRELTQRVFNLCQSERAGLRSLLAETTALADTFRLWVTDSDPSFLWVGDTFNDRRQIDPASSIFVDTIGGVVMLPIVSSRPLSRNIVAATIDRTASASGIPGDNLEIDEIVQEAFTGDRPEPQVVIAGEIPPRRDSLVALWDGSPETWFEWERNYIKVPQTLVKAGKAFVFDETGKERKSIEKLRNWNCYLRWPGDPRVDTGIRRAGYPLAYFIADESGTWDLTLGIQVTLDQPRVVSWIRLVPYHYPGGHPQVDQILVSQDGEVWRELLREPTILHPRMNRGVDLSHLGAGTSNFEGVGVWAVPSTPIQHVKIFLRQPKGNHYEPTLGMGHRFFFRGGQRIRGPVPVIGDSAATLLDRSEISTIDDANRSRRRFREGFDILFGWRQVIAIRDLLLEERIYSEVGHLLSRPLTFQRPVRSVALLVSEELPLDWPATDENGVPWIDYEISPDGETWYPIVPQRSHLDRSVVRFPAPTTSVQLRVTFGRPIDRPNESPILRAYAIKALV